MRTISNAAIVSDALKCALHLAIVLLLAIAVSMPLGNWAFAAESADEKVAIPSENSADQNGGSSKGPSIAFAARIAGDSNRTRLVVDFDRKTDFNIRLIANPRRIIIDMAETEFNFSRETDEASRGLVKNIRYGVIAPGKSRIVLMLEAPATVDAQQMREIEEESRHRLIVDLVKATPKEFSAKLSVQDPELNTTGAVAYRGARIPRKQAKPKDKFTIILDPGHGGIDGGAVGANRTVEKTIVLDFSKKLAERLTQTGKFEVILTRDKDVFVSLSERVKIARRNRADLLLSIHADSLPQSDIRGGTVYTLSEQASDALSARLARSENLSDVIAGFSAPQTENEVRDILVDLTMRETKTFSRKVANTLVAEMTKSMKMINNPHRSASFRVLKAPEVPSVLLELGYLSNREDEVLMREAKWQDESTDVVVKAILSFFEPRIAESLE